jgi:hypothetical protein
VHHTKSMVCTPDNAVMLCAFRLCLPNGETSWPRLVVGCRRLLLLRDALAVVVVMVI